MTDANEEPAHHVSMTESTSTHNILTIPPETFELIAEEVDNFDLLPLRLVSREICDRVQRTFLNVHFYERAFLLSNEDSLRTLLAITENETFARSLETIDLCIEEVPAPNHRMIQMSDHTSDANRELQAEEQVDKDQQKIFWDTIVENQNRVRQHNVDLHLLTMAFSRLRRLDHVVEVRIVDNTVEVEEPQGTKTLQKLSGRYLLGREDCDRPVSIVLQALSLSLLPIKSLTVHFDNWGSPVTALIDTKAKFSHAIEVFRHLTKLHLQIDTDMEHIPTNEDAELLCKLLASPSAVTDLSIHTQSGIWAALQPASYAKVLIGVRGCLLDSFQELVSLDIQGINLSRQDLISIVSSHKKLRSLHFHAADAHSPHWAAELSREQFEAGVKPLYFGGMGQDRVGMLVNKIKESLPFEIPGCTLVEMVHGKHAWFDGMYRMLEAART